MSNTQQVTDFSLFQKKSSLIETFQMSQAQQRQKIRYLSKILQPTQVCQQQQVIRKTKKIKWNRKQDQKIILIILSDMVKAPYLDHSLERIKTIKQVKRFGFILQKKISLIKRKIKKLQQVYRRNYSEQSFPGFIVKYWKKRNFKDHKGQKLIKQMQRLFRTKSRHMEILQQMISQTPKINEKLQDLFLFLMGN